MPEYIEYKKFLKKYPLLNVIQRGSQGKVYESTDDNVVKVSIKPWDELISFFLELNVYCAFRHPNLMSLLAYTLIEQGDEIHCLLALPRGYPFFKSINEGLIDADRAIKDVLEGLACLHMGGFAHSDIKPSNIMFHDGRMKLIDFGISTPTILTNQGVMMTGVAYTTWWRDPQYNPEEYNDIKVELYPVGKIYEEIMNGGMIEGNIIPSDNPSLLMSPLDERPELNDLISGDNPGEFFETYPFPQAYGEDELYQAADVFLNYRYSEYCVKEFMQMMHLFRRCYAPLRDEGFNLVDVANMCGFIITSLVQLPQDYFLERSKNFNLLVAILIHLKGITLTRTTWDYLPSGASIHEMVREIISYHYRYPNVSHSGFDYEGEKNPPINLLYENVSDILKQADIDDLIITRTYNIQAIDIITPNFDEEYFISIMEGLDFYEIQSELLYYKNQLYKMKVRNGIIIFNHLRNHNFTKILKWYFTPGVYKLFPSILITFPINPFAIRNKSQFEKYYNLMIH